MSPWTDSHLLPPNAPWEGPDLDAATCSLHDASLTQLPHRVRTQPREVCRCSCPTGVLTFSCLCGPEANQVVLWMLTLAIAHPQHAHTDTKKMSSLSVPENRLPNVVLRYTKCAVHYCLHLAVAAEAWTEGGRNSNAPGSGCKMVCITPTGEGRCHLTGASAPLPLLYPEASDSSLPGPPPQLDSKGDSRGTESKVQTPLVQCHLVARPLQC